MANDTKNISRNYEIWEVETSYTEEAERNVKTLPYTEHKGTSDCYDYKKTKKVGEQRMHPNLADAKNSHSHNSKIRYYEVEGSEIDHTPKKEQPKGEETDEATEA